MRLVRNRSVPAIIPDPSHEQLGNTRASIRVAMPHGRRDFTLVLQGVARTTARLAEQVLLLHRDASGKSVRPFPDAHYRNDSSKDPAISPRQHRELPCGGDAHYRLLAFEPDCAPAFDRGGYGFLMDLPLYLLFWMAVPYFFLTAGYFYGVTVDAGAAPFSLLRRSCRSLTRLFVIWVAVYSVIGPNWITNVYTQGLWSTLSTQAAHTMDMLVEEHVTLLLAPRPPIFHLWFCRP